jgi:hypothetical protein
MPAQALRRHPGVKQRCHAHAQVRSHLRRIALDAASNLPDGHVRHQRCQLRRHVRQVYHRRQDARVGAGHLASSTSQGKRSISHERMATLFVQNKSDSDSADLRAPG